MSGMESTQELAEDMTIKPCQLRMHIHILSQNWDNFALVNASRNNKSQQLRNKND